MRTFTLTFPTCTRTFADIEAVDEPADGVLVDPLPARRRLERLVRCLVPANARVSRASVHTSVGGCAHVCVCIRAQCNASA